MKEQVSAVSDECFKPQSPGGAVERMSYQPLPKEDFQHAPPAYAQQQQQLPPGYYAQVPVYAQPPPPQYALQPNNTPPPVLYAGHVTPSHQGTELQPAGAHPHDHCYPHHHRVNATAPLVLGILSLVLFWPLCWCGLAMARRLRRHVRPDHPDHGIVTAAYSVNLVSLILGLVGCIVMTVMIALYFGDVVNLFQHTH